MDRAASVMLRKSFSVGDVFVGGEAPVFIIAEAGVNHNGDTGLAKTLVVEAKRAGADCVKFQTFKAKDLVTATAPKAAYQLGLTDPDESQFEMLAKLELSADVHCELIELCQRIGIVFLSTPYNFSDVDMLDQAGAPAFKLASMHLTELPMIEYTARKGRPVVLSTGMGDIDDAVRATEAFSRTGNDALALLQCTTDYPAKPEEANLRAIGTIERATGTVVGYSDNSGTVETCALAVAAGARIIEKHFTLDNAMNGPDHSASANPSDFAEMVRRVRSAEKMLGSGRKEITESEKRNIGGMKRSLVAAVLIRKGTLIKPDMLGFKRPASGLSPARYADVLGKRARRDIEPDSTLTEDDLIW